MARLGSTFNATQHDTTQSDYEDLPNGVYRLEMEASEVVETGPENARTGQGLKYTSVVLEPEAMKGRKFFGFINLENQNPQAQEIGQKELASLCRAVGVTEIEDSEDLHFKAYTAKLGLGKPSKKKNADGTPLYPARTEVKRYYFPDEGDVPAPEIAADQPARPKAPTGAPANDNKPAAPAATGKARPWSRAG
ncbi:DUF669 domain-containing protein [Kaustia mangrovi]|uniref:DUF669 domain-containing protein n=1 Tax=Kaustia mangrovi TaxID=2593653 RepID=A0A7S8C521_9HYPH|nr:DUF669 domain-containing protein [Kaustia mangrovi]QPC43476.1 DUF669 domain-containing protein [Kaustia mangrovi]